jgi:hypothetical protein
MRSSPPYLQSVTMTKAAADFEGLLAEVLEPLVRKQAALKLSPLQLARILRTSVHGFKNASKNSAELRQFINDICTIILTSIRKR